MSTFSVGGLASGVDTNAIVDQLLQLERAPVIRLQQRQRQLTAIADAWSTVTTRLSAVRRAVAGLTRAGDYAAHVTVTSSDDASVAATRTGTPTVGSLSFTVDRLGTVHQVASGSTFASADALVGAGSVTVTVGGVDHTVATDDTTTLSGLATAIGDLGAGVSAQAVKVADGSYQMLVSSRSTGASQAFTLATDLASLGAPKVIQQAQDAQLTIGSSTEAITVTRASNTVTDLIDGVSLQLKQTTTTAVTVATQRDTAATADAVVALIEEVNAALATLKDLTRYDAASGKSGLLLGDATARTIVGDLRRAVSDAVAPFTTTYSAASSVGITMNADGGFTVDRTRLEQALTDDPTAVIALFARGATSTDPRVSYLTSTDRTLDGTYDVTITQAARIASITGTTYQPPPSQPETFTITAADGTLVTVTVDVGDSVTTAVSKINSALTAAGVTTITASETVLADGTTAIRLDESRYGSAVSFTVDGTGTAFGLSGTHAGADVAGTIGGQAATGSGRSLTSTTGDANGLTVRITASQAEVDAAGGSLALGTVAVSNGIAGRVSQALSRAEGSTGSIVRARALLTGQIDLYQDRIDDFDLRLQRRELTLRQRFAAMESLMARLVSQGNWLAAQLGAFTPPPS